MTIGARTAAWSGEKLPYDAEVEYLRATGNAFIDTGILPSGDLTISIDIATNGLTTLTDTSNTVISGGDAWGRNYFQIGINRANTPPVIWAAYGNSKGQVGDIGTLPRVVIGFEKNVLYVGGVVRKTYTYSSWISQYQLRLFANNRSGVASEYCYFVDNYGTVIKDGEGDEIAHMIPVRKGGEGYMYDTVRKILLGNANTVGRIEYGPDVSAANGGV